jgi:hypothetical protein
MITMTCRAAILINHNDQENLRSILAEQANRRVSGRCTKKGSLEMLYGLCPELVEGGGTLVFFTE